VRRTLLLSAFLGASVALMGAQTATETVAPAPSPLASQIPAIDTSHDSLFSSSADSDVPASADVASVHAVGPNFGEMMQYGGRQRYGRPRYRGGNTNPDGSEKYTFFAGVGLTQPLGNTYHYDTPSYSFQVGAGRNFNAKLGLNLQFDWDNFGLTGSTLGNQQNLYNYYINLYNTQNGYSTSNPNYVSPISGLDGYSHVWSFSLDPTYTIYSGPGLGAYVVAGVGFYHKITTFTAPSTGYAYDPYTGFVYEYAANSPVDSYTSNAPGFNGGFGLTYKFSRFSNERFFAEVRYVFVDNSQRSGVTVATASPANAGVYNDYPANSNRTTYIPIKFGIRF
jgi:hypothetical protein